MYWIISVIILIIVPMGIVLHGRLQQRHRTGPLKHIASQRRREELEDMLKSLYHSLHGTTRPTVSDIAVISNEAGIKPSRAEQLIIILRRAGLVQSDDYHLTPAGCAYALGLIRTHRLYERYLAEHSGYAPEEWHRVAHRMEHRMNADDVAKLDKQLGYPAADPHGDPIPSISHTATKPSDGLAIQELCAGSYLRIQHIEDANASILGRLMGIGLFPGALIKVIRTVPNQIIVLFEGEEHMLSYGEISALTLKTAADLPTEDRPDGFGAFIPENVKRLTELPHWHEAVISGIDVNCRGSARKRLLDLGFVRGSRVSIYLANPLGNPTAYRVRGAGIALRDDQARFILFNPKTLKTL